jgi:TP901 family phage tail tape measure protein
MASSFNLTAELNLRGPSNLNQVVGNIRKQLSTVSLDLKIDPRASSNIQGITSNINNLSRALRDAESNAASLNSALRTLGAGIGSASTNIGNLGNNLNNANNAINNVRTRTAEATSEIEAFGRQAGLAVRRFAAFSIVTGSIYAIAKAFGSAYSEFLNFNKEFIRLQQVTFETATGLKGLSQEIVRLSQGLGVTSQSLLQVSVTLSQAGLSAAETKTALEALAKSSLAPSFDDMNSTVEGSIALMKQFGISANDLESALGSINAVAAKFAVEASDIITAIQRTGGVFASASQGVSQGKDALNEFIAVFTSVRATTRESAETIATGLRTIFSRIQRGGTIEALKQYGVELTDVEGKFVGAYEAVRRLSDGLSKLDTRDIRFSAIIEELGGFRQVGKVIPLIQQFATAQEALNVAQRGAGSLAKDVATAQEGLGVKITKVREQFVSLVRDVGQSKGFQTFVDISLKLASALISIADAAKSVLPALTAIIAVKGISNIGSFVSGLSSSLGGGGRRRFARGGLVPGGGSGDTVPAMLTPGEFVIRKKAVETIGINNLHKMNKYAGGGPVSPQKLYSMKMKKYVEENLDSIDTINFNKTIYGLQSSKDVQSNTFEKLVKDKLGRGTHKGGNYPVDIIGTGKGPVEVRNRSERTPDFVLADKLMRYYLEDGQTDYIKRFTKKKNQKADSIQLGNIGIAYNLAKYKPSEKYTKLAGGGSVDDTVPALLTPGEFVINKKAAQRIGHHKLNRLNNADKIRGYNKGGSVGFVQSYAAGGGASIFDSLTSSINKVIQSFKQLTDTNTLQRARQLKAQGYDRAERRDIIGREKAAKDAGLSPTSLLLGAGVAGDLLSKAGAPALGAAVAGGAGAAGVTKTVVDSLSFLPPQLKAVAVGLAAVAGAASAYLASLREIRVSSAQKSIETLSTNLGQAFERLSKTTNATSDSFGEIRTTIDGLRNAGQVISQAKTEEFVPTATIEGQVYSAIGTVVEAAMLNLVDTGIGKMDKREELSYSKELESAARPAAEAAQKGISEALKRGLTFDQARTAVGATDRDIAIARGGSAITDLEAKLAAVQSDRTLPETVRNKKEAEIKQAIALTTSRLVEAYKAESTAKQQNIAINKQLIESSNQYSQSLQNTVSSVQRASSEFSQYVQDINAEVGIKGGGEFQPRPNKIDTEIFKNLRAYSQAEVSSAIDNLASRLNFSPEFTQQTKERVSVKQNLEKGIQGIFGSLSVKSGTGGDVSGEFDKAIRELLAPLKLSKTSLPPILEDLRREFNNLSGSGADVTLSELAKNNPGLQKFFDTVGISSSELDKMSEAANEVAAEVTRFGSKLSESLVLAQEYSNAAVSARTEGSLRLSQTLNEPVALDQLNQSFNNAIRSLTRVTFAGDNRRGGPQVFESYGGTTDVATIEARLRQTEEEQKRLNENKNRTPQEEVRFAQVNAQATNLEKALKQLATDSSRASNALSKIEEVQKAKQGRTDVLMDLLSNVNNPEYMTDFIMNQQKFSNIMAGQGNSFDIPGAIQALQIKMRGQTADDALKTRGDFLEQIFQMLPADLANAVKQTLEAPEYNVSDFIKEYNDAIKAMAAANEALASRSLEAAGIFETAIKGSANYFADKVTNAADNTTTTGSATATTKANGGLIYAARGKYVNFQPKGTDTVPAMLTPGEFVVNAKATKKNLSLLKAINSNGKAAGYSMGGMVYLQGGGLVEAAKARLDEINAQIAEYVNQTRLYIQEWTDSVIEDPKDQAALDRQKVGIEKINKDRSLTNEYTELLRRKTEAQEALNYEQKKVDLKTRMETDTNERIKNIPRNEGESDADYKARATKQLKEDDDRDQKRIEAYEERQKNARLQEQQRRADAVAAEQVRLNNRTPKERLEDERRARKEAAEQERAARVATNISRLPEAARRDAERKRAEEQRALANKAMGLSGSEDSAQTIESAQNWWVRGGFMDNPGVGFTADLKTIIERYKASEQYQKDKAVSIESKQEGLRDFQRASEPSADYKAKLEERREASSQKEAQDRERTQKNQKTAAEKSQLDSGRVYFNQMYTSSGTRYSNASTDDILTDLEANRGRPQGYYNLKPEQQAYLDAYIGDYQFRQRSAKNAAEAQALEQKRATKLEAEKAEITLRTRGTPEEQAARNKQIADAEAARLEREQKYGLRSIDYQFLTESQMEEQKRAGRGPGTPFPFVRFNEFLVERGKTDQAAREKAAQNAAPITEEQKRKEEFNLLSPIEQIEYNRKIREDAFSPERAVTRALQRKVTELDPSGSENLLELAQAEMDSFFMTPSFEDQASLDASVADIIARARQNAAQRGATTTNRIAASNEERKRRIKEAGFDREIETFNGQFNPYFDTDVANKQMFDTLSKLPIVRDVIQGSRNSKRRNASDSFVSEVAGLIGAGSRNFGTAVYNLGYQIAHPRNKDSILERKVPHRKPKDFLQRILTGANSTYNVNAYGGGLSQKPLDPNASPEQKSAQFYDSIGQTAGETVVGAATDVSAVIPGAGFIDDAARLSARGLPKAVGALTPSPTGPKFPSMVFQPPPKVRPPFIRNPLNNMAEKSADKVRGALQQTPLPNLAEQVRTNAVNDALMQQMDRIPTVGDDLDIPNLGPEPDDDIFSRFDELYPNNPNDPFRTGTPTEQQISSYLRNPASQRRVGGRYVLSRPPSRTTSPRDPVTGQFVSPQSSNVDPFSGKVLPGAPEEYRKRKGALNATTRANGGLIYASQGKLVPYQPRGTDTVPAMLTPGEFVINRKAAKQNMGLLKAINNGQTISPKRFNKGGIVDTQYYETAGPVASPTTSGGVSSISVDSSSLDTAFSNFQTYVGSFGGFVGAFNEAASKLGGLSDVASSLSQIDLTTSAGSLNLAAVSIKDASSILQGQIGPFSSSVTELAGVISRIPSTITLTAQGSIPVNGTITVTLEGPGAGNLDETNAENIQKSVFDKIALAINQATAGSLNIVQT